MPTDEPHQRAEHMIEAISELGFELWHITERCGDLETREHLAERAERGVVARRPVFAARVGSFGDVQRRTAERSPTLPSQVGIVSFELANQRPERSNEVQEDGIDTKHGELLCCAPRTLRERRTRRPLRAQGLSRLRAKRAPRAAARRPATMNSALPTRHPRGRAEHGPGLDGPEHGGTIKRAERRSRVLAPRGRSRSRSRSRLPHTPSLALLPPALLSIRRPVKGALAARAQHGERPAHGVFERDFSHVGVCPNRGKGMPCLALTKTERAERMQCLFVDGHRASVDDSAIGCAVCMPKTQTTRNASLDDELPAMQRPVV